MSLKENVEVIKEELSAEEQFFEKAVLTERVIKKYKNLIVAGVALVVVGVGAKFGVDIMEQNRIDAANKALLTLQKDPTSQTAQATLKEKSEKLYALWSYAQAVEKKDLQKLQNVASKKLAVISDLSEYQIAILEPKQPALEQYALEQNKIFKDLAVVADGVLYIKKGDVRKAKEQLKLLPQDSTLQPLAKTLQHYGVK